MAIDPKTLREFFINGSIPVLKEIQKELDRLNDLEYQMAVDASGRESERCRMIGHYESLLLASIPALLKRLDN
jgi:hypothetical protein